jgi:hypothetical protein
MIDDQDFYAEVSVTDFPERYYDLCKRYSRYVATPYQCSKSTVIEILSEIDKNPIWDSRDKSFNFNYVLREGTLHQGFVIQRETTIEYWFWLEGDTSHIGDNYAVIAHEAAILGNKKISETPYPRPIFQNLDDLRIIINECFRLADILRTILIYI